MTNKDWVRPGGLLCTWITNIYKARPEPIGVRGIYTDIYIYIGIYPFMGPMGPWGWGPYFTSEKKVAFTSEKIYKSGSSVWCPSFFSLRKNTLFNGF